MDAKTKALRFCFIFFSRFSFNKQGVQSINECFVIKI